MAETKAAPMAKGDPRAAANKKLLDAQAAEGEALQAKHDATIVAVNERIAENNKK